MALKHEQIQSVLIEIANLIVNEKSKVIVAMNKSNITTVAIGTDNNVVADQVIENLVKNADFISNLSSLITDVNLQTLLEQKKFNSTGSETAENIGANFGKKMTALIQEFALTIGGTKNNRDLAKVDLKKYIVEAEEEKKASGNADLWARRTKRLSNLGLTLLVLGTFAVVGLGIYILKKERSNG